jgi:hypothetical protein
MCCSSDPNPIGVNIDTQVNLVLSNSDGSNLLNPSTPGHFSSDSIKLFYLTNGQKVEVYQSNLTYPRNFFVAKNESNGEYFIRVFLNEGKNALIGDSTTTYIQWSPARVDTINAIMFKSSNLTTTEKVWINGDVKYDSETNTPDKIWGSEYLTRLIFYTIE